PLEEQMNGVFRFVVDAKLVFLDADFSDDQDRPAVVIARKGEQRRQVGRATDLRLRVAAGQERKERKERKDGSLCSRSHVSPPSPPSRLPSPSPQPPALTPGARPTSHHLLLRLLRQDRGESQEQQRTGDVAARPIVEERQGVANSLE